MQLQPLNPQFNDAACFIASRIFPLGFDVYRAAPNTFHELHHQMDMLNRMAIWSGDYSHTPFADTETWWQFRAWHDWVHHRFGDSGADFSMPGEHVACHIQAGQLMRLYGRTPDVTAMIALLFCHVVGQLEAAAIGQDVSDGHSFCSENWQSWMPYAERIVAEQGYTDVDAIAFGRAYAQQMRAELGPVDVSGKSFGWNRPYSLALPADVDDQPSMFA